MLISAYDKTDRLREMPTRGREGVKNSKKFAYVLNGSPLMKIIAAQVINYGAFPTGRGDHEHEQRFPVWRLNLHAFSSIMLGVLDLWMG